MRLRVEATQSSHQFPADYPSYLHNLFHVGSHEHCCGRDQENMCEKCYLAHFQKQADDYCADHGIVTLAQKRKFVREKAAGVGRMREPGEDWDEGDAA